MLAHLEKVWFYVRYKLTFKAFLPLLNENNKERISSNHPLLTVKYANPKVLVIPDVKPTNTAPHGLISMLATADAATPPASVAF